MLIEFTINWVLKLSYSKWNGEFNPAGFRALCWNKGFDSVQIVRGNQEQAHVWSWKKHAGHARLWKWIAHIDSSELELPFSCRFESYQPKISSPCTMSAASGHYVRSQTSYPNVQQHLHNVLNPSSFSLHRLKKKGGKLQKVLTTPISKLINIWDIMYIGIYML